MTVFSEFTEFTDLLYSIYLFKLYLTTLPVVDMRRMF
jgi:hypothetical protein